RDPQDPDYFLKLPLLPGALELFETVRPFRPVILTASPIFDGEDSEAFRNAAAKKREWCRRHLGITDEHDFVCTVSWKKHSFVGYRPASVQLLIDDRERNCAEWER